MTREIMKRDYSRCFLLVLVKEIGAKECPPRHFQKREKRVYPPKLGTERHAKPFSRSAKAGGASQHGPNPKTDLNNPNRPGGRAAIFSPSPQVIAFTRDFPRSPLSPMCPRTSPRRSILGGDAGRK